MNSQNLGLERQNRNIMEQEKRKFNSIVIVVFVLVIVRHVMSIMTQLIKLMTPETIEYQGQILQLGNHAIAIYNLLLSVVVIASMIMVLCKKIAGAYIFIVLQIINCICLSVMGENDTMVNVFVTAIMIGIFVGVLYLRKNEDSGWDILRNRESLED